MDKIFFLLDRFLIGESILGGLLSNCNDFNFDETRDIWADLERTITAHDRRASGTRTQNILFTSRTHNQLHPIAVTNGLFEHFSLSLSDQ